MNKKLKENTKHKLSRRAFMKITGITTAAVSTGAAAVFAKDAYASNAHAKFNKMLEYYDKGKLTHSFCEMCFWNCGLNVYSNTNAFFVDGKQSAVSKSNNVVHKIEGKPLNPNNYGHICAKGNSGIYELYGPNRLKYPLIRAGERGEGKWRKASWEEAFDYIGKKLKPIIDEFGPSSLAMFMHGTGEEPFKTLGKLINTPNIVIPAYSQCLGSRDMGWYLTYGTTPTGHNPYDTVNSKYMISMGRNVTGAIQLGEAERINEGIARGGKLVYVDPRYSEMAAKAYRWLSIRPGADMAFVLGLIHVIIRDNLVNYEFVKNYTYGYDKLSEHVKKYTPKWAEHETDIPAKTIETIAWEFAEAAPQAIMFPARRMSRYGNDTQTVRAIAIANALIGNWGMPGGFWKISKSPIGIPTNQYCAASSPFHPMKFPTRWELPRADISKTEFPLAPENLGRENGMINATLSGKPYPIKAWIVYGTNPILSGSNAKKLVIKEAFKRLDLIVDVDIIPNDIGWYSDIILPESTYLERYDLPHIQGDKYPFIAVREPATKPIFDTKGSWEISGGIGKALGFDKYFKLNQKQVAEAAIEKFPDYIKKALKEKGIYVFYDTDPYPQASGSKLKFNTPTGKIELYSTTLHSYDYKRGYEPLPTYKSVLQPNDGEFRLLFGRVPVHTHARTQNNPMLHKIYPDNKLWINKIDAAKLSIKNGDKVLVHSLYTKMDSLPIEVYVTDLIKRKSVFMAHGFGHISKGLEIAYHLGAADSFLVSNDIDPISGAAAFNNAFVTLRKV